MADGRLRTMMTGADGDAIFIEMPRDTFVWHVGDNEGQNARLAKRRANGTQTGNR